MRVILRVTSGPSAGRTAWLREEQALHVGRTESADFAVAADGNLSSMHFVVETFGRICRLRDLNSRNGTEVNGRRAREAVVLRSGDRITAGQTAFEVTIEGGMAVEPSPGFPRDDIRSTQSAAALPGTPRGAFKETACPSGWSCFEGVAPAPPPVEVARSLAAASSRYKIHD
jgi:predicted component of type VI protein secretion system